MLRVLGLRVTIQVLRGDQLGKMVSYNCKYISWVILDQKESAGLTIISARLLQPIRQR
jgi:hypothetical protein